MINKVFDSVLPVTGGAAASVLGVITFSDLIATAMSAAIFATVGGIIGYYINKLLKKMDRDCKTKKGKQ